MKPMAALAKPGLMVDLDALFDTRLATLERIDVKLAANALSKGYLDREDDSFEHLPLDLFKKVYALRDEEVLGNSSMTPIKEIVFDFIKTANDEQKSGKTGRYPDVYINVWPYRIAADAIGELISPIYKACDKKANIHVVNLSPDKLLPSEITKELSFIIKYDYMDWLIAQGTTNQLQNHRLQHVTLIAPRLYLSGKPNDEEFQNVTANGFEPHTAAELYFSPYIKLELYIARMFSAKLSQEAIEVIVENIKNIAEEE